MAEVDWAYATGPMRYRVDRELDGHWYSLGTVDCESAAQAVALTARAEGTYRVCPSDSADTTQHDLFRVPSLGQPELIGRA